MKGAQASDRTAIFNPGTKECRQNLGLLSAQEFTWESYYHRRQVGYRFSTYAGIFIIDIFPQ